LDHQNDFVEILSMLSNAAKCFDIILVINFVILSNYFDGPAKLFSYLAEFLDSSAKLLFPCECMREKRFCSGGNEINVSQ